MKVQVFVRHDVDPEVASYLKKVQTYSDMDVCGSYVILDVYDPDTIPADIRKIAREVDRLQKVCERVGFPWMAKEVLDGKAVIQDGFLQYINPKSKIRREVENSLGELLSDKEFNDVLEATTSDIVVNRLAHGKITPAGEVIKIAARCADVLRRCGK